MKALDKKLFRDMRRLWAQSLAVALVMAAGIATLLTGLGAYYSLHETRRIYYDRSQFGDVFASAVRVPNSLLKEITQINGVAVAETRIMKSAILDIEGFSLPATGVFISLPAFSESRLNQLYFKSGRPPQPGSNLEVVVSDGFAKAHGFNVGAEFHAILNGAKRRFKISGTVLSPEYIYAIGPGDMMPDDKRFGVIWIREPVLAAATNMKGAFNSVSMKLAKGANTQFAAEELDRFLAPYGGEKSYLRDTQQSHAFLDAELKQLWAMSRLLPPAFLIVTAFLVNMVLSRLIGLEREQIGLLKALGYSSLEVASHYAKLVLLITAMGIVFGYAAGSTLNTLLTGLYARFFHFPYEIFVFSGWLYAASAVIAAGSALVGAAKSIVDSADISPAIAMRPQTPVNYRKIMPAWFDLSNVLSQLTIMTFRNILRWPLRSAVTASGIALSVSLLVTSLFSFGSVNFMIDAFFDRMDRQDATVYFGEAKIARTVYEVKQLPGVLAAEPFRAVAVELSNGNRKKRTSIVGKEANTDISRVLDAKFEPVTIPANGLLLSDTLASYLKVAEGDLVHVDFLGSKRGSADIPVVAIVRTYVGLLAVMRIDALNRLRGDGILISGAHLLLDPEQSPAFLSRVKDTPALAAMALQRISLQRFRETIAQNINYQIYVFASLATIIAFGVVYNSARIQFSERARELASLRVLGFTNGEVSSVLLLEYVLLTVFAVPLGWVAGYYLSLALVQGFQSDLYRIPFVIERSTYAYAALIVIIAVGASALTVQRRVTRLDLIRVLKTRD
jgi:putative ABC transport system permease protein